MTDPEDDTTESACLESIEDLVAHFQEVMIVRQYALDFARPEDADNINKTFESLLETILRKIEMHVDNKGPVDEQLLQQPPAGNAD